IVSVASVPFASTAIAATEAQKTDIVKVVETAQRPVLGAVGLVLILVVVLLSFKSLRPNGDARAHAFALSGGGTVAAPSLSAPAGTPLALPTNTVRDKVASSIEQQPDTAARVVRAWLKEA
ncbi:MAG TPA: hypothetical protein VHV78_02995, partial [Gemmatimonadaceae bacterium]|nr:hypothetical protein [Gemmatimonadaceae bacterium]